MPEFCYPYLIALNSSVELMRLLAQGKHFNEVYEIMINNVNPVFIRHMVLGILSTYSVRGHEFKEYCKNIKNAQ